MRLCHLAICCAVLVSSSAANAQFQPGAVASAADSASAARTAWAAAIRALRAGDSSAMRHAIERAATFWPSQQTYVWNLAVIAAAQRDTATVRAALTRYASLGLGRDLSTQPAFAPYRESRWFELLRASHDANRAALANSTTRAVLPDSTIWPEGVDFDPRSGNFYVASIRRRTIVEVSPNGSSRELWPREQKGIGAVMGVRVDTGRRVLWATLTGLPQMSGFVPADTGIAALVQVRAHDGAILKRWDLPVGHHVLGDMALGSDGAVYVSDSRDPVLYRLRPERDTLEAIRHPLFRSLQGIAVAPGGRVLYVADYSHGILRVDLATDSVSRVADPPNSTTLGCDGIVWFENSIVAVQNGIAPPRIMRFRLDPSGRRIVGADVLDRNFEVADEPTIGTIAGREFVYVANSQWEKYSEDGALNPRVRLTRPVLLAVLLRP